MLFKKQISVLIILCTVCFSCKKKDKQESEPETGSTPVNLYISKDNSLVMNFRKVLVEQYTGHTCGNCPRAAEDLESIAAAHPGKVVGIAIHAGTQFSPPNLPDFPEDFRTPVGTDWDNFFGMSAAGLPKGCVNRSQIPYPQPRTTWSVTAGTILSNPQEAKLLITTTLDTNNAKIKVNVKTTFLKSFPSDSIFLSIVITEDSIIARQKDYAPPVGATVENGDERPDYRFNNVLRDTINGVWGQFLKINPVMNDTVSRSYTWFTLNPWPVKPLLPKYNLRNTNIVVFIYKRFSKEIIQVERLRVM